MATIQHAVYIGAPCDRVWAPTIDIERWPALTPTVTSVERLDDGPLRVGSTARLRQPAQPARVWRVVELDENKRFAWETKGFGIKMTATHMLAPTGDGGTRNTLLLETSGPLGRIVGRLARRKIADTLATENAGLKAAAERVDA